MLILVKNLNQMSLYLDPVEHSLASKELRFANYIVDYIIAGIVQFAVLMIPVFMMEVGDVQSPADGIFSLLLSLLVYVLYFALTEYLFKGRTIAKFITGTKAVTVEGNDLDFTTALIRSLCRLIPFEAFSFLGETGWHDSISKTRVVSVNEFEQNRLKFNAINQIGVNS